MKRILKAMHLEWKDLRIPALSDAISVIVGIIIITEHGKR